MYQQGKDEKSYDHKKMIHKNYLTISNTHSLKKLQKIRNKDNFSQFHKKYPKESSI